MALRDNNLKRIVANKANKVTFGNTIPHNSEGNNGDITVRSIRALGNHFCIKNNGRWYFVPLNQDFTSYDDINRVKSTRLPKYPGEIGYNDSSDTFLFHSSLQNISLSSNELDVASGNFTLDVSGNITLDADDGLVYVKDGGTSHFIFDCNDTRIDIFDDANASDYCRLQVNTNGATTLTTVDADAALAHFTIDADGYITLDSANLSGYTNFAQNGTTFARFESHHSSSYLTLFENSGASDDDYFQIACAASGLTTISTTDAAGAGAHLMFEPDGSFLIKEVASAGTDVAGYGQIWVKNSAPNELYFTTDAGNDIQLTSGTSVAGGGTVYHYQQHQFYASATTDVYVPFGASTVEGSSTATSMIDDTYWIAPYAGKLVKVYLYARIGPDETDLKLRVNGSLGASMLSGGAVDADNNATVYSFDCDQNNTFSAGDVINLYIDITTAPYQVTMSSVWEID